MPKTRSHLSRLFRLTIVLVSLTVAFAAVQGSALAATHAAKTHASGKSKTAESKAHSAASGPAEGIWDSCNLTTQLSTCEQRLTVMAKGGFKVVVLGNINSYSEQTLQAYAAYAQSVGMSVMWELNDPGFWGGAWTGSSAAADYGQFASACGCTDASGVLNAMISFLASLPGTYGYYAADDEDISGGQTGSLQQYVSEIKSVDPNHMVMIGANAGQGQSNARSGAVMGNEIYPVTTGNLGNVGNNLAQWQSVQQQVTQGQNSANRNGVASAYILQAFTFGDNLDDGEAVGACNASMSQQQCYQKLLYPSAQVQLELRNEVLEHSHAKLILWYSFSQTYGQAGSDTYSTYPTGAAATARWTGLTKAINSALPGAIATAANAKSRVKTRKLHGKTSKTSKVHGKTSKVSKTSKASKHHKAAHSR